MFLLLYYDTQMSNLLLIDNVAKTQQNEFTVQICKMSTLQTEHIFFSFFLKY